jgi:N-acetylmuramoyl-L-alanine amidase
MAKVMARCRRRLSLTVALLCLIGIGLAGVGALAATGGQLFTVRLDSHGADTRLTLGLIRGTAFRAAVDAASGSLFVDFPDLAAMPGSAVGRGTGLVRAYHAERLGGGGVRLAFDLKHAATITSVRALPAGPGTPPRAVIELASASMTAMRAQSGAFRGPTAVTDPPAVAPASSGQPRSLSGVRSIAALIPPDPPGPGPRISPAADPAAAHRGVILSSRRVIVIDAGHGGIDPGAPSIVGYHEKQVTLATARLLARALEHTGRYKVVMTRDSDVFLKLHERVALARAAHGNLFISLHADSAGGGASSGTRGASIYTLSETASDAESERYAQRENRADAIGGVTLRDQSDDVAGILVDLTVRETVNEGNRLAGMLAESLEHDGIGLLPRAPHRAAGFAVLKSPDIPSVLIEMGYLSDPSDARALADPAHQARIARAVADGVDRYFAWLDSSRP